MNSRFVLFFVTFLALALFAAANPVPVNDATLVKKALKQYDARAAQAKKRDDEHFPKPSKHWRAEARAPTGVARRDDQHLKPSKHYRAEARAPTAVA
ncbi:hypothetical protein L226DRAFT_572236 [Lentinus tigrinus ALCF2SS1-7]|uniref:Uncharacterized protein n=1 Tax=Lentinus tigrinus ALCF2SS1-6 TaxID=1328759 RepID=A0A5C2S7F7_9APHY|nr:hypothetical protein L227DRAFT_612224 [Lentinus tigrinus ALCF2SS1-6]RPD73574.1 hypothetical protein L226DRAFT_572236 [Lentinus tigrinus ALCF2SS1-7]